MSNINWLASYPKSGNTWVRLFLNHYLYGIDDINSPIQASLLDSHPLYYQTVSPLSLREVDPMSMEMLRYAALIHLMQSHPSPYRVVKTHNANAKIHDAHLIPASLTDSAIYIVRDPRDVAVSLAEHMAVSIDRAIEIMGTDGYAIKQNNHSPHHWLGSWSTHVGSWLRLKESDVFPVEIIRYEDMQNAPITTFTTIVEAFGLENDYAKIAASLEAVSFDRVQRQEQERGFRETQNGTFFSHGEAGGWMTKLTPEQVDRIEANHCDMMNRFSYGAGFSYDPSIPF